MSTSGQPPRKRPTKGKAARARRRAQSPGQQLSQAEIKAMEARAKATIAPVDPVVPDDALDEDILVVADEPPPRPRRSGASGQASDRQRKRPAQQTVRPTLTKEQEYAYIRSDLRRLLVTAGPLLMLMLGLLFIIDR